MTMNQGNHYLNNRIFLNKINNFQQGSVVGRIESIQDRSLYISDESGNAKLEFENLDVNIKEGFIVECFYCKKNESYQIEELNILNECGNNPVIDKDSFYFKLNKNNKKLLKTLKNRQDFFQNTRLFFIDSGFLEIHSPALVESPGIELHLEPFETTYFDFNLNEKKYYLPTSPEFALKEVLSGGIENIFEIAKVFRNRGEKSDLHKPEFFMLEWYRSYSDYHKIMDDCERFLRHIGNSVYNSQHILYNNKKCSFDSIEKKKLKDIFGEYKIELDNYSNNEEKFISDICDLLKISKIESIKNELTKEDLFFKFFLTFIEPDLGWSNPVILYEYPIEMCSLSRECEDNPLYGERFELYICGIELANAYGELINYKEQEKRFAKILSYRKMTCKYKLEMPLRFIKALKSGIPPCSGIALGIERLFMLFEGLGSINETNLF